MKPQERFTRGTYSVAIKGTHFERDDQRFRELVRDFKETLTRNGFAIGAKDRPEKFAPAISREEPLPATTRAEAAEQGLDEVPRRRAQ